MTLQTTGQAITDSLIAHGVDTIFGIPGAHMYDFNDALAQRKDRIRFITTRHEQGAGYMAYGYAKSTGRVGTYTVVPGPGVLNSGAALCTAYGATTPVLCVTGNIMANLIGRGRGQLHELPDQLALLRGLTKWSERINHPTEAPTVMAQAFRQLSSGRIRPVAVEAPWDVFGMKADVTPIAPLGAAPPPTPDPDSILAAAKLIAAAKRPLITVGAGAPAGIVQGNSAEIVIGKACPTGAHRQVLSVGRRRVCRDVVIDLAPHRSIRQARLSAQWPWLGRYTGAHGSRCCVGAAHPVNHRSQNNEGESCRQRTFRSEVIPGRTEPDRPPDCGML
jgi:acetolactate synthase-1/2/3 large subunit